MYFNTLKLKRERGEKGERKHSERPQVIKRRNKKREGERSRDVL